MAARLFLALLLAPAVVLSPSFPYASAGGDAVMVNAEGRDLARTVLNYSLGDFAMDGVIIGGQEYVSVSMGKEGLIRERGAPDLPSVRRSIIIPGDAEMAVRVTSSAYREFTGIRVAPSKGYLLRTVNPAEVPYTFGDAYSTDAFYPGDLVKLRDPYILRDYRGMVVELNPFQYNPVTQTLRCYTDVTLVAERVGSGRENVLQQRDVAPRESRSFQRIYGRHFLNYDTGRGSSPPGESASRESAIDETGDMLIICHDAWLANIQALVDHKNARGISTTAVGVSTIGNDAASIKSYIQGVYDSSDLAFVLLVGDGSEVASPSASGGSADPTYALVAGSDHYPDIMVGRFSAQTAAEVDTQVQRTIEYEQMPATGQSWFRRGTGIASDEGPGHNGEYDYQHVGYVRDDLLAYGYSVVDEIYDPGATASQVSAAVNAGRGVINYCGHGSETFWVTTGFSNSDVNALTNDGMLPFIISVACVNGDFEGRTCFAEAWLRATNGSNPAGAIGMYASSINQSWSPPMTAQDESADLLVTDACSSFGALCYSGACKMIDVHGSAGEEMFDTWHVFGDPSVEIWGIPSRGAVSFDAARYPLPGTATVTLRDSDLDTDPGAADTVTVEVSSDTESTPESLLLTETGVSTMTFSGSIPIAGGAPNNGDGTVQVADGDTLTVVYHDADDGTGNPADVQDTATIDDTAPVISNVQFTLSATSCTITWTTNEASDSLVRHGEGTPPATETTDGTLTTSHSVRIQNLQPLTTYYFEVASADSVGNTATDNNGGSYYQFTTLEIGAVLFVDDDEGDAYETYFTNALDAGSYSYDVWDVSAEGTPSAADLGNYQVVIWNCGDDYSAANAGITTAEESVLTAYMDGGGSVFLSGQDIIYCGVSSGFRTNYLHLANYGDDDTTTEANGIAGDRISDGMNFTVNCPFTNYSDSLSPDSSSTGVFTTDGATTYPYCAVRYPADGVSASYKIVFFAIPFECLSSGGTAPNNAATVMDRVLQFLGPVRVSGITPTFGLNDRATAVTISGAGFKSGLSVRIEGIPLMNLTVTSTEITATVPDAVTPGSHDVVVRHSDSLRGTLSGAYTSLDPLADVDGDGLTNEDEVLTHGTNPFLSDTDEDGLDDGVEVGYGTDPLSSDSDSDGLTDYQEVNYNAGDGGYDPYDPATNPTGTDLDANEADTDGDGYTDLVEYGSGSDPLDPLDVPQSVCISFQPPYAPQPSGFTTDCAEDYGNGGFGWR